MGAIGGTALGAGIGGVFGILDSITNNAYSKKREQQARAENYRYNEMAANNADERMRAMTADFWEKYNSPSAQLNNLKAAGLSPSMLFADGLGSGVGGASATQGEGASGIHPNIFGVKTLSPMEGAQLGLIAAQTDKTKAEASNIETDTEIKQFQRQMEEFKTNEHYLDYVITTSTWEDQNSHEPKSMFEIAQECYTYEEFLKKLRQSTTSDESVLMSLKTERGQEIARSIFNAANQFERDIAVLSDEKTSAEFNKSIVEKLNNTNFAELNAKQAIMELRAAAATNELTEQQKDAWNDLLKKLEKKHGTTTKDIIIVMGMLMQQFMNRTNISVGARR